MKREVVFLLLVVMMVTVVSADASFISRGGSYSSYYGQDAKSYWPILGSGESCEARQDMIVQVSPLGCEPAVVRSDLLAEQNVPVFCQLDALKVNPLIDINQIKSVRFKGDYPVEVAGIGFHPSRAALRTQDRLLGSPLVNDIGYVVVVLKKTEREADLPDLIQLDLEAEILYDSGNAFGVGQSEMFLEVVSDSEWGSDVDRQTIWDGRYSIRLDEVTPDRAGISIYDGERRISSSVINQGRDSEDIYLPGGYCSAGLNIHYEGLESVQEKARLKVDDDTLEVYTGSRILDGKCRVQDIEVNGFDNTGRVSMRCGGEEITLSLRSKFTNVDAELLGFDSIIPEDVDLEIENLDDAKFNGLSVELCEANLVLGEIDPAGYYSIMRLSGNSAVLEGNKIAQEGVDYVRGLFGIEINSEDKIEADWQLKYRERLGGSFLSLEDKLDDETYSNLKRELVVKCEGRISVLEKEYEGDLNIAYNNSLMNYGEVVGSYPGERIYDVEESEYYGEKALLAQIALADELDKKATEIRLRRDFADLYPDSDSAGRNLEELERLINYDVENAKKIVDLDSRFHTIKLLALENPMERQAEGQFIFNGQRFARAVGDAYVFDTIEGQGYLQINALRADSARVRGVCPSRLDEFKEVSELAGLLGSNDRFKEREALSKVFDFFRSSLNNIPIRTVEIGESIEVCGETLELVDTNIDKVARVRVVPKAFNTQTATNFTVGIGIEKRLIDLSPDKAREKIDNLDESIEKWDSISEDLGDFVQGMKGACFATSAVLTAKNFLTGLNGESIARQKVMRGEGGWNERCADLVSSGEYSSQRECYLDKKDEIESEVNEYTNAINTVNGNIQEIEEPHTNSDLFGSSVNRDVAAEAYAADLLKRYEGRSINGQPIEEVLAVGGYDNGYYTYDQLREIELNLILESSDNLDVKNRAVRNLAELQVTIKDNFELYSEFDRARELDIPVPYRADLEEAKIVAMDVERVSGISANAFGGSPGVTHVSTVVVPASEGFTAGTYLLGLKEELGGNYRVADAVRIDPTNGFIVESDTVDAGAFTRNYKIGLVTGLDANSYRNEYESPEVRYFETEPYKGLPAVVPFDRTNGWYVATKQTLPAFGGKGVFDSSGRAAVFWLCNVGDNKREQFNQGLGDDICQRIDLDSGQSLGQFPGLSESEARRKVEQGIRALNDAANQYGRKTVRIGDGSYDVGNPAVNLPGTECEDFMSPGDCQLLFNVCDPVICPSSRCDLGGKYPVADVVQTGIVGSALLCLPNFQEGIAIPVCLTGIKAGIDGYVSILESHRQCLQENVDTGRLTGICDQISSVYACEFFWRQAAPLADVLVPKTIEYLAGQGTRGGGEYLSVSSAWENAQSSVNYFTNYYGENALEAFNIRSTSEAGGQFCRAFVSAKAPSAFEVLTEPDSPPQFHAWFSSILHSDVTLPPTSQYKVFYHIFAGDDAGVSYRVYLKDPGESSFYNLAPSVPVATGFIPRGQFATDTIDFTAPDGYKQLCVVVNGQEECGFKQVSTSFAIDYLRDSFVQDELERRDITSENECISGGTNLGALLNPNIQEIGEEVLNPEIYNRGVSRICGTQNPGSGTNPLRWVDVGYCDDTGVRCWLDKESVDDAISAENLGIKNETLTELDALQEEQFVKAGFLGRDDAQERLRAIDNKIDKVGDGEMSIEKAEEFLSELEDLELGLLFNDHKAYHLLLKGRVYDKRTRSLYEVLKVEDGEEAECVVPLDCEEKYGLGNYVCTEGRCQSIPIDSGDGSENLEGLEGEGPGILERQDFPYTLERYFDTSDDGFFLWVRPLYNGEDTGILMDDNLGRGVLALDLESEYVEVGEFVTLEAGDERLYRIDVYGFVEFTQFSEDVQNHLNVLDGSLVRRLVEGEDPQAEDYYGFYFVDEQTGEVLEEKFENLQEGLIYTLRTNADDRRIRHIIDEGGLDTGFIYFWDRTIRIDNTGIFDDEVSEVVDGNIQEFSLETCYPYADLLDYKDCVLLSGAEIDFSAGQIISDSSDFVPLDVFDSYQDALDELKENSNSLLGLDQAGFPKRWGYSSETKLYVAKLRWSGLITPDEFLDIVGGRGFSGWFDNQMKMEDVGNLLLRKSAEGRRGESTGGSGGIEFPTTQADFNKPDA